MHGLTSVTSIPLLKKCLEGRRKTFTNKEFIHYHGFFKLQPAGQIRPAKPFHPTRKDTLSIMKM